MRKLNPKAQSLISYAVLIAVLVAALLAMSTLIRYSVQGKFRQAADVFGGGEQYALELTTAEYDLGPNPRGTMRFLSPRFENNGFIPKRFSCEGRNVNPPLILEGVPGDAKSLILIVDDPQPDAPMGTWVHWVVFDISPTLSQIDANSIPGKQGINYNGMNNYEGPCPPPGTTHQYFFRIYALDTLLGLDEAMATKAEVEKAMQGHILDKTELVGLYKME